MVSRRRCPSNEKKLFVNQTGDVSSESVDDFVRTFRLIQRFLYLPASKIGAIALNMESTQGQTSLFQVYLRLRPPIEQQLEAQSFKSDGYLTVEPPECPVPSDDVGDGENTARVFPKYITVQAPNDSKKREKFAFTKVFQKEATQLEIFEETEILSLMDGVLRESRDGLVATLGVTGSGKVSIP